MASWSDSCGDPLRRVLTAVAALNVAMVLLMFGAHPASAGTETTQGSETTVWQETTSDPPPTQPTGTENPGTESSPEPSTTIAPPPETSVTPGSGDEADPEADQAGQPEDPMSDEAPGEEAPATDITVPPKDTYQGQEPFKPAEVLWSSVAAADQKLEEAKTAKAEAIREVRHLRKRRKELDHDRRQLDSASIDALDELAAAGDRLATRAVFGFQRFGSGSDSEIPPDVSDYQQIVDLQRRSKMISSALDVDESDLDRIDGLHRSLNIDASALLQRAGLIADYLSESEAGIAELDEAIDQAAIEHEAFRAGSELFIHGVKFPIAGDYPTPLIDSFGFPRMTGTPDEHWHEGIDLFADRGTPLVATERGIITRLGIGRLGGLKFWLKGESGSEWYYAHLDSFAPGLADGVVVEAGQLVGYVGNTGNAVGTPPHLHMQLHPLGDRAVNPYPLLKVVSDMDLADIAAGTHPGYEFEPTTVEHPEPEPVEESTTTSEAESPDVTEGNPTTTVSPPVTEAPQTTPVPPADESTTAPSTDTTTAVPSTGAVSSSAP